MGYSPHGGGKRDRLSMRTWLLQLCVLLAVAGCKGPDDHLEDLRTVNERDEASRRYRLKADVYDAGQLVHEAFAALADADALTLSQMARSIGWAGRVASDSEVPLCRAQAVALSASLCVRYPIPPRTTPWITTDGEKVRTIITEAVNVIGREDEYQTLENGLIDILDNPDRAVADKARQRLKEIAKQDFGTDPEKWRAWWEREKVALLADSEARMRPQFEALAGVRLENLKSGAALLIFLGEHLRTADPPGLRDVTTAAVQNAARQVAVYTILAGLRTQDAPDVRGAAAVAVSDVPDPAFGDVVVFAVARERDPVCRGRLIEALSRYPKRETVAALIRQMEDAERSGESGVALLSRRALTALTAEDRGSASEAWSLWFEREGKDRWP